MTLIWPILGDLPLSNFFREVVSTKEPDFAENFSIIPETSIKDTW